MSLRDRFPPNGRPYELFDSSVFLVLMAFFGFLLFPPPSAVNMALGVNAFSETQIGWLLAGLGTVGIACSFSNSSKVIDYGYNASRTGGWFMFINFAIALVITLADRVGAVTILNGAPTEDIVRVSLLYMIIMGYAIRRMTRDNSAVA